MKDRRDDWIDEILSTNMFRHVTAGVIFFCIAVTLTLDMHKHWYKSVTMTPRDHLSGYYTFAPLNGWLFYLINVVMLSALVVYIVFLLKKIFSKKGKKNSIIKIFRLLDLRFMATKDEQDNDNFCLMHGIGHCKTDNDDCLYFDDVLCDTLAFLDKHPTETVFFLIDQEHDSEDFVLTSRILQKYIADNPERWRRKNVF